MLKTIPNHDDRTTVDYLCTSWTPNVYSLLYDRAARTEKEMGYFTYILDEESGDSLKASGWEYEAFVKGQSWSRESRPRTDKAPTCDKQRWSKTLN